MPHTARETPPPLELLCLKALWKLGEGDVKTVQAVVAQSRPLAYTTIMTVLERLARKGRVMRGKRGRAFVYSPKASQDSMRRAAIRELVDGFFDGSETELLRFLQPEEPRAAAAAAPDRGPEAPIDTVLL